jgi:hypothetical protein
MLVPSRILEKIVPRLFHPHSFKISVNKVLREQVVNGYAEIFRGGHLIREALIKIQVGVVKAVDHVLLYATVQVGQIANHPGNRIHAAADCHLYYIVMPVTVGIAAFAVDRAIFFLAVSLRVQTMRGTEEISSR